MRRLALAALAALMLLAGCGASHRLGGVGPCVQQPSGALSCRGLDNTSAPTITGSAVQGSTLTAGTGTWNTIPTGFTYRWFECDVSGLNCQPTSTTTSTYTLGVGDVGSTLQVRVIASKGTQTTSADSAASSVVTGGSGPTNTVLPVVTSSSSQIAGHSVSVNNGTWTGSPTSFAYQWQDCVESNPAGQQCSNISGATSSSYTLQTSDVGNTVQAVVTAANGGGATAAGTIQTGMVGVSGAHTYYISFTNGADTNNGTSTATPWQHAPGMVGCTGTCAAYSHANGDRFIFEGGDTWPASTLPLNDASSNGGSSGAPDYYGVETDWFTGATFSRPIFNAGGADIASRNVMLDISFRDWIDVDDIEFTGFADNQNAGFRNCEIINVYNGNSTTHDENIIVNRIYVPNFAIDPTLGDGDCSMIIGDTGPPYAGNTVIENSTLDASTTNIGRAIYCLPNAINNTISGSIDALFPCGHGQISGNNIGDCGTPPYPSGVTGMHENAIESLGSDGPFFFYNNVIHDTGNSSAGECESMIIGNSGESDYVYNNVFYNLAGNHPGIPQTTGSFPSAVYFFNNTMEAKGDTGDCAGIDGTRGPPTNPTISYGFENNLCISNSVSGASSGTLVDDGAGFQVNTVTCGTASCPVDHNVALSPTAAAADGYTGTGGTFVWLPPGSNTGCHASGGTCPTDSTAATSGGGTGAVNLTSATPGCGTSGLGGLCSDATYAGARAVLARPSSGAWDVGAYQVP